MTPDVETTAAPRIALITGAAKRIGKTLATRLHDTGFSVIVHYHQSQQAADDLVAHLNERRADSAIAIQADLCNPTQVNHLAEAALRCWGKVDVLINNASLFFPTPLGEATQQHWQQLMGSNAQGALFLSKALASSLKRSNGSIINMIDMHIDRPLPEHSIYCMAKSALASLTRSLASELAPEIRVNGIAPGAILWPEGEISDDDKQQMLNTIPLARLGSPDDIADTACFLLQASYITGQILYVDGGRSIQANG